MKTHLILKPSQLNGQFVFAGSHNQCANFAINLEGVVISEMTKIERKLYNK